MNTNHILKTDNQLPKSLIINLPKTDTVTCYLCGSKKSHKGIVFKGYYVCEKCIEYISDLKQPVV